MLNQKIKNMPRAITYPTLNGLGNKPLSIEANFLYMKLIPLTQGKFAQVDDEDFIKLNKYKWYLKRNSNKSDNEGYAVGGKAGISMHRFLLNPKKPLIVDHIDGNGLNNQKSNLRICTKKQNAQNRASSKNKSSDFLGVHYNKKHGEFRAHIRVDGVGIHLGCFKSEWEAAVAYNTAATFYFKEFARLNVINKVPKTPINPTEEELFEMQISAEKIPGEVWKNLLGFEGYYRVSNLGRMFNFKRLRLFEPYKDKHGYNIYHLRKDRVKTEMRATRAVALSFIPNPKEKPQVLHHNGIKTDDRVDNLRWATPQESTKNAMRLGLM